MQWRLLLLTFPYVPVKQPLVDADSIPCSQAERHLVPGGWPARSFDSLRELLKDPNFLSLTKSWQLRYFIDSNWEYLSDTDAAGLREVLVDTFDKHSDWIVHS
jgi:hypothetical protein